MRTTPRLSGWSFANALGLGIGFVAYLQTFNLMEYGLDTWMQWRPEPPGENAYASILVALLVGGAILGSSQALVLRFRASTWILATAVGLGVNIVLIWPLLAAEVFGRIPGPAEPMVITIGGCSFAGICQYLLLHRQGIGASRWLALWIGGLMASIVPTAVLFITLEAAGALPGWPGEVFLSGFMVAGVAALISGRALFAAISHARPL